ncbi:hypothetical protein Goshw_006822, partial [Gossypium schwendimanii]|nr:hypothetical protein [Gossypium schwendimanii]
MGSLLSGWDSPISDPSSGSLRKPLTTCLTLSMLNRSLTKEEIEAFWRSKRKTEEEHLNAIHGSPDSCNQQYGREYMRSSSMPIPNRNQGFIDMDTETSLENIVKQSGWWTRSTWAFLNEPPVLDRPTNNYQPQFHVASLSTS